MNAGSITPAVIVAALLSILLEWSPVLSTWWQSLTAARRAMINALLVAVVSILSVLGNCYWWGTTCPADIWQAILQILLTALLAGGGNQFVHAFSKREVVLALFR